MKIRSLVNLGCAIVVTAAILGGLFRTQTFGAKPTPTPTVTPTPTPLASSNNCPAPPNGTAMVSPPTGGFAIDGNLLSNTPVNGVGDWLAAGNGPGGAVLNANGSPVNPALTFHLIDPYSTAENNFAGGKKVD